MIEILMTSAWLLGCSGLFAYIALRCWKRARSIEDTATSRVRSASQGYVELVGQAAEGPAGAVAAPFTGKPCVYWSCSIHRAQQRKNRSTEWVLVSEKRSDAPIDLDDGTGRCSILPDGAEVRAQHSITWHGPTSQPTAPPEKIAAAKSSGDAQLDVVFEKVRQDYSTSGEYRYRESRIEAGDPLYASGFFRTERESGIELHSLSRPPVGGRPFLVTTQQPQNAARSYRNKAIAATVVAFGALLIWALQMRDLLPA